LGCGVALAAIILHVGGYLLNSPVFSSTVFAITFIVLSVFGCLSLGIILRLDPELRLPSGEIEK